MPATREDKLELLEFCADNHYNVWAKENGELRVAIHFNYWSVVKKLKGLKNNA